MQHCFLLSRRSLPFLGSAMGNAIANHENRCDFGALSSKSTHKALRGGTWGTFRPRPLGTPANGGRDRKEKPHSILGCYEARHDSRKLFGSNSFRPNMTGRRFHRTTEAIPRRPWKAKRFFASRPVKISIKRVCEGCARGMPRHLKLLPLISIVGCPGRRVIPVPEILLDCLLFCANLGW